MIQVEHLFNNVSGEGATSKYLYFEHNVPKRIIFYFKGANVDQNNNATFDIYRGIQELGADSEDSNGMGGGISIQDGTLTTSYSSDIANKVFDYIKVICSITGNDAQYDVYAVYEY